MIEQALNLVFVISRTINVVVSVISLGQQQRLRLILPEINYLIQVIITIKLLTHTCTSDSVEHPYKLVDCLRTAAN